MGQEMRREMGDTQHRGVCVCFSVQTGRTAVRGPILPSSQLSSRYPNQWSQTSTVLAPVARLRPNTAPKEKLLFVKSMTHYSRCIVGYNRGVLGVCLLDLGKRRLRTTLPAELHVCTVVTRFCVGRARLGGA